MNVRNPLPALIADLRAKRLLPVVAVLIVALIAIPIALSTSAARPTVPKSAVGAGTGTPKPASGVPAVRITKRSRPGSGGRGRDPFLQQQLPQGASSVAASTAAAASAAKTSTANATSTRGGSGTSSTATTTVTTTVTTPAAATPVADPPEYVHYAVKLSFGAAGVHPHVYNDPARFTTLPSLRRLALVFLGVGSDGRTAEFLVADQVAPAGQGHCSPSRTHCVFLYMKPGQEEIFLSEQRSGNVSESILHYVSVAKHRVSASSTGAVRVARDGRRVVSWVAQLLPALSRLRYGSHSGLLESKLTVPARSQASIDVPIRLKRAAAPLR